MNKKPQNDKKQQQPKQQPASAKQGKREITISSVLGECIWLLGRSPPHSFMFVRDLDWLLYPPLHRKQLFVFHNKDGQPVGMVSWAFVDDETEKRLEHGLSKLKPDEWKNGDNLWLVDLIAPFGKSELLLEEAKNTVFKDRMFKYVRRDSEGKPSIVVENKAQDS